MSEFVNRFSVWAIDYNHCTANEYKAIIIKRLNILKLIKIEKCIKNLLFKSSAFKTELVNAINKKLGKGASNLINEILDNNYNMPMTLDAPNMFDEGNTLITKSAKRRKRKKRKKTTKTGKTTETGTDTGMRDNINKTCVHCGKNGRSSMFCPLAQRNTDDGHEGKINDIDNHTLKGPKTRQRKGNTKGKITKGNKSNKYTDFVGWFKKENKSKPIMTSVACYCRETCRNNKDTLKNYLVKYGLFKN
eukprot:210558_1